MNDNQVMAIVKQITRIADSLELIEDAISNMDESFIFAMKQSSGSAGSSSDVAM